MPSLNEHRKAKAARFGENLRIVRERRGMSQAQLAGHMRERGYDWKQPTVARAERGGKAIGYDEADDLAIILRVSVDRFSWEPPEEAEAALVGASTVALRKAGEEVSVAVMRLLAMRHHGERSLPKAEASKYQRVQGAAADLRAELEAVTLEDAIEAGAELWEAERDGG
jgi:transcriptional regulator with XRE-family HTH domain